MNKWASSLKAWCTATTPLNLRHEVLLLTEDALLFYRSFASSAEKQMPCPHITGARAVEVLVARFWLYYGAFALQISTLAEEVVRCGYGFH